MDGLLLVGPVLKMTRLKWLTTPPVSDPADSIKAEIGKLEFLRGSMRTGWIYQGCRRSGAGSCPRSGVG